MTVAVYGATGYTGRLVAQQLRARGVPFVLAGRDAQRLDRLAADLAVSAAARVAAVDDPAALAALLEDCRAVINCAADPWATGEALVRAAIDTGTHYVDANGDQGFLQTVFERHGAAAARRGVALVPGAGFDYALGDCVARIAARGREPLDEMIVAYAIEGSGVSGGSLRGATEAGRGREVSYRDGAWRSPPLGVQRATFVFPGDVGRRPVTRYGSGEVVTVPRHTRVRNVSCWVTTTTLAPHPELVPFFPLLRPAATVALRTPLRRTVGWLASRAGAAQPSADDQRTASFVIAALARGVDGTVGRASARGGDFYELTAVALAYAAEQLAGSSPPAAGALGPAAAYDPEAFLDALAPHGVSWEGARAR